MKTNSITYWIIAVQMAALMAGCAAASAGSNSQSATTPSATDASSATIAAPTSTSSASTTSAPTSASTDATSAATVAPASTSSASATSAPMTTATPMLTPAASSAVGRTLPTEIDPNGATYSIPDAIQTNAAINPGNSGGVLLDGSGQVVGVTSALESVGQASAGVGFAIPSNIVKKVVPELIQTGRAQHPWLGISGTSLTPELSQAMNLQAAQRGALVDEVLSGSPAEQAGLKPSTQTTQVFGTPAKVGGDVITAIDNHPVKTIEDLISYLARNTDVGQTVQLSVLRGGSQQTVSVKLGARPDNPGDTSANP